MDHIITKHLNKKIFESIIKKKRRNDRFIVIFLVLSIECLFCISLYGIDRLIFFGM